MREQIHLVSMASYPNLGDELIARRWLRFLAEARPDAEVWLDTRHPGAAALLFEGDHPRLRATDTVFRLIEHQAEHSERSIAEYVTDLGTPLFDLQLMRLREAGTIHLLGGGFLNAQWPINAGITEAMRAVKQLSGARLIATGQGLLPLLETQVLDDFDHVSVRDEPSAEAAGAGAQLRPDDAFLTTTPAVRPLGLRTLLVCIQSDAIADGALEHFVDQTAQYIENLGEAAPPVVYVEALPGGDYAGYAALRDRVKIEEFVPFTRLWSGDFPLRADQGWITTRFHHHLVGALHGIRGIALSGSGDYYDVKHESLHAAGSGWHIAALNSTADQWPSLTSLRPDVDALNRAREEKLAEAAELYPAPTESGAAAAEPPVNTPEASEAPSVRSRESAVDLLRRLRRR